MGLDRVAHTSFEEFVDLVDLFGESHGNGELVVLDCSSSRKRVVLDLD